MGVTHEKTNHAIGNSADDFRLVQLLCTGHVAAIMLAVQDFAAAASYTVIPVLTFNSVCPLTAILITTSIPTIFYREEKYHESHTCLIVRYGLLFNLFRHFSLRNWIRR